MLQLYHVYWEPWYSYNSLFRHSAIFSRFDAYWGIIIRHQVYVRIIWRFRNFDLFRTQDIFKSMSNMSDDQAYPEPWHSQNSLFKHFQWYLGIFRDTITGVQLKWGGETYPDFEKKDPDCVQIWVTFSIENIVSRVSRRKNSIMFPCGVLFSCVFSEMFIKVS